MAALVERTLSRASAHVTGWQDETVDDASSEPEPEPEPRRPADPAAPSVGARSRDERTVGPGDTAAAVGHADPTMAVLSTPTIALWFELATNPLMPSPDSGRRHVGVGILVHHVGQAEEGETVDVEAEVEDVSGRSVVFRLSARVDDRVVALGTHHRMILRGR